MHTRSDDIVHTKGNDLKAGKLPNFGQWTPVLDLGALTAST